ncbi:SWIM zinc finger family protein [Peribacillus butanolivorans]
MLCKEFEKGGYLCKHSIFLTTPIHKL